MSKIARKLAKIFGSTAGLDQIAKFGSFAEGTPEYTTDVEEVQSYSEWLDGWFSAVTGANSPAIEDMNGACFVFGYQIAYLMQAGVAEWNTDTTYYIGSVVSVAGVLYVSQTDTNLGNAVTSQANWRLVVNNQIRTVTASESAVAGDDLIRVNAASGDCVETLPAVASTPIGKRITVKDVTTTASANVVTVKGNGSELIDPVLNSNTFIIATHGDSVTFSNNGTTWDII